MATRFTRSGAGRCAFTLIELLVVVAIIAILISILLPSLRAARDQARQLRCLTNMRSAGAAAFLYAEDNDGLVVRAETRRSHFAISLLPGLGYTHIRLKNLWIEGNTGRFARALREVELLQCPSFPRPEQVLDYVVSSFTLPYFRQPGDNTNRGPAGDETAPVPARAPHALYTRLFDLGASIVERGGQVEFERSDVAAFDREPSRKIYVTEAFAGAQVPGDPWFGSMHDTFVFRHLPFASEPRISNDRRHPGGVAASFFDGHAKVVPWKVMDSGFGRPLDDRLRLFTSFRRKRR